jgi:hypothetical protein
MFKKIVLATLISLGFFGGIAHAEVHETYCQKSDVPENTPNRDYKVTVDLKNKIFVVQIDNSLVIERIVNITYLKEVIIVDAITPYNNSISVWFNQKDETKDAIISNNIRSGVKTMDECGHGD